MPTSRPAGTITADDPSSGFLVQDEPLATLTTAQRRAHGQTALDLSFKMAPPIPPNVKRVRKAFGTAKGIQDVRRLGTEGLTKAIGALAPAVETLARVTGTSFAGTALRLASAQLADKSQKQEKRSARSRIRHAVLAAADVALLDGDAFTLRDLGDTNTPDQKLLRDHFDFLQLLSQRRKGNLEILRQQELMEEGGF